jgi:hypothetical protein
MFSHIINNEKYDIPINLVTLILMSNNSVHFNSVRYLGAELNS